MLDALDARRENLLQHAQRSHACGCRVEDRKNGIKPAPFGGVRNGKGRVRPAAIAFNPEEARAASQLVETRRTEENMFVMNSRTFIDGYERKRFGTKTLTVLKDPPLAEVRGLGSAWCYRASQGGAFLVCSSSCLVPNKQS
jgi:hypothetical protein